MINSSIEQLDGMVDQLNSEKIAKNTVIAYYNQIISELDRQHFTELEAREYQAMNQKDLFQMIGENAVKRAEYERKREMLVRQRDDVIGVSDHIREYLESRKENPNRKREPLDFSKFDVDSGDTTVDNSLLMLGKKV